MGILEVNGSGGGDDEVVGGRARPLDITALVDFVQTDHLPHSVIVDCSSADPATREHAAWLARGVHVVGASGRG